MNKDFSLVEKTGMLLISADCINRHCDYRLFFSTGFGGVSQMPGGCTVNLSMFKRCENDTFENVQENFKRFASACEFRLEDMSLHREVHESNVVRVTRKDLPSDVFDRSQYGAADGQVTTDSSIALFGYAGDCTIIFMVDPVNEVSGMTHCGYKNNLNGTISNYVREFVAAGGNLKNVIAVQGPSVSKYCFDVGKSFAEEFEEMGFGDCLAPGADPERFYIDLPEIVNRQLQHEGLEKEQIHIAPWCTFSSWGLKLPSHRRDKGLNANLGGVLFKKYS